jgi:hypothetical protein
MYEDDDLWPIKCPECGNEFLEKVSRIKTGERIKCPTVNVPWAFGTHRNNSSWRSLRQTQASLTHTGT